MSEGAKLCWLHIRVWPMGAAQRTILRRNAFLQERGVRGVPDHHPHHHRKVHFLTNLQKHIHWRLLQGMCWLHIRVWPMGAAQRTILRRYALEQERGVRGVP